MLTDQLVWRVMLEAATAVEDDHMRDVVTDQESSAVDQWTAGPC